ncbi:unnamed protein product [Bursaphelenchus xylophilus]|uniref:Dynactin subunit 4 n=1 Tax=Bursaphelenchus xylophilus TaxID=6326 RepID=A0A1I7S346_BURXY|nr:unnamed protein product [Bursaphelenchus xylophilus]CAG9116092.1 unnamed protein product [Bursaphelenchus xylophilus]
MNGFLELYRVQYECPCGSWFPLSYLYFCKPCKHVRCTDCALEDVDKTYCPICIDDTVIDDTRFGKGTCSVCYTCPICSDKLIYRALTGTDLHYLHCNNCMWNTNEAGLEGQPRKQIWPAYPNSLEDKLQKVHAQLKVLSSYERAESEKPSRRSMSNLGHVSNDRYGILQLMQTRRKKILARPESIEYLNSDKPEELDLSIYTQPVDEGNVPTLDQVIRLPYCNPSILYPVHKKLQSRKHVRCPEHDVTIYRGEFAILKTAAKHHIPCSDFCPELKFSHETVFSATDMFSIFITVLNSAFSAMDVRIEPLQSEDRDCLICDNGLIELKGEYSIPNKDTSGTGDPLGPLRDNTPDLGAALDPEGLGTVVFRIQHRVGLHLKCRAKPGCDPKKSYLLLQITYKTNKAEAESTNRVKLYLA